MDTMPDGFSCESPSEALEIAFFLEESAVNPLSVTQDSFRFFKATVPKTSFLNNVLQLKAQLTDMLKQNIQVSSMEPGKMFCENLLALTSTIGITIIQVPAHRTCITINDKALVEKWLTTTYDEYLKSVSYLGLS